MRSLSNPLFRQQDYQDNQQNAAQSETRTTVCTPAQETTAAEGEKDQQDQHDCCDGHPLSSGRHKRKCLSLAVNAAIRPSFTVL